jgi:hypothetical protein
MRCSILNSVNPQHCTALYLCTAPHAYMSVYILYRLLDARSVSPHSSGSTAPSLRPDERNLLTRRRISIDFGSGDRIPVEARFSATVHTDPWAHPAFYTMGIGSFSGLNRPGRGFDNPPHLAPRLRIRAIPLLPLWVFVAYYRVNCTFTFTITTLYLMCICCTLMCICYISCVFVVSYVYLLYFLCVFVVSQVYLLYFLCVFVVSQVYLLYFLCVFVVLLMCICCMSSVFVVLLMCICCMSSVFVVLLMCIFCTVCVLLFLL